MHKSKFLICIMEGQIDETASIFPRFILFGSTEFRPPVRETMRIALF